MLTLPKLDIRPVLPDDLSSVSRLEESCFTDPYPPYFLQQLADANPDTFLVALSEGSVVGYVVVDRWDDNDHLISIAVHPERRRLGIARRLLLGLEVRLGAERPMKLEVRRGNNAAIQLYVRSGFRETGMEPGYYRDGEDALLMERRPQPG